jgi:DNA-binding NtrC family response regulator
MAVVLVVEDEEQVLVLAKSYLEEQGHKALSADTIDGALAILGGDEPVDVLFTDIGLHEVKDAGLELAKQAIERQPSIQVLYTTGQTVTDGMKALFVKGSALLEKPYTVDQLAAALAVHFRVRPASKPGN